MRGQSSLKSGLARTHPPRIAALCPAFLQPTFHIIGALLLHLEIKTMQSAFLLKIKNTKNCLLQFEHYM